MKEKWMSELRKIAQNMESMTCPTMRRIYLHHPTGAIVALKKLSNGGLKIELPLPRAGITKLFLIGASKQNLALFVRLKEDDSIEKMICAGRRAFKELKKIGREALIVSRGNSLMSRVRGLHPATS